jgi:hypothetical protein
MYYNYHNLVDPKRNLPINRAAHPHNLLGRDKRSTPIICWGEISAARPWGRAILVLKKKCQNMGIQILSYKFLNIASLRNHFSPLIKKKNYF